MVQTTNRFFDEVARLMNDAAGAAQGVRREVEVLFRTQAERILRDLDVVKRDDFEAVKEMARLAREENETLKARVAALEAALGKTAPPANRGRPRPRGAGHCFLVFRYLRRYRSRFHGPSTLGGCRGIPSLRQSIRQG
jgi:BMFP domain-containing protein YqiC